MREYSANFRYARKLSAVMRGRDPRIHDEFPQGKSCGYNFPPGLMDCRVKPGNDKSERAALQ